MSQEHGATEANEATEAPNVAEEFSELCDAMRDKYGMPDGDWKALLDQGMALYARIPEGALSFEGVQVVTNESALTAVDVLRRDLEFILGRVEIGLRNGVAKEEDAGSEKPEREIGADEGAAWAAELMRNLVQHRSDTLLEELGERGNSRPATRLLAEAATARLAERAAALRESPRPHPAVLHRQAPSGPPALHRQTGHLVDPVLVQDPALVGAQIEQLRSQVENDPQSDIGQMVARAVGAAEGVLAAFVESDESDEASNGIAGALSA